MAKYLVEFKALEGEDFGDQIHVEAVSPLKAKEKAEKENSGRIVTDVYLAVWGVK